MLYHIDKGCGHFCELIAMVSNCVTDEYRWFCDSLLKVRDY